jgi:hypothetical protein
MVHFLLSIYKYCHCVLVSKKHWKDVSNHFDQSQQGRQEKFCKAEQDCRGAPRTGSETFLKIEELSWQYHTKKRQKDMGHFRDSWLSGPRTDIPAEPPSHRTWITKCVLIHNICRHVYTFSISFFSYLHKKIQKTKIKIPHCRNSSKIQ